MRTQQNNPHCFITLRSKLKTSIYTYVSIHNEIGGMDSLMMLLPKKKDSLTMLHYCLFGLGGK